MKLITNAKRSKPLLIGIIFFIILAGSSVGLAADYYINNNKIFSGISVNGLNLGGLSKQTAKEILANEERLLEKHSIDFLNGEKIYKTGTPKQIGVKLDTDVLIEEAYLMGRKDNIFRNLQNRLDIAQNGVNLPLKINYDKDKLNRFLEDIAQEVNRDPKDAELIIDSDDKVLVTESYSGKQLNKEETIKNLENSFASSTDKVIKVQIAINEVKPAITKSSLQEKGIKQLLGSFTTTFNPNNIGRTHNIKIAATAMNKLMIAPGQDFSFNEVVGPRSSALGYQEAPVIVNGKLTPGIGGGVCQVSSTLYNTVLLSNLEITKRFNHSLPSSYVGLGRDATVTYGGLDFQFKNNSEHYIYLTTSVNHDKLTIKIYGTQTSNDKIKIVSEVLQVIEPNVVRKEDPDLLIGEEKIDKGSKGYKVKTWRVILTESGQEKRELLSEDNYKATETTIWYGTKQPPISPPSVENTNSDESIENEF
jgi:vancomycin resistance protein YoaR